MLFFFTSCSKTCDLFSSFPQRFIVCCDLSFFLFLPLSQTEGASLIFFSVDQSFCPVFTPLFLIFCLSLPLLLAVSVQDITADISSCSSKFLFSTDFSYFPRFAIFPCFHIAVNIAIPTLRRPSYSLLSYQLSSEQLPAVFVSAYARKLAVLA